MDLCPYICSILSQGFYASFRVLLEKVVRSLFWIERFILLYGFAELLRQVDLVTTADEYLLNWFVLTW